MNKKICITVIIALSLLLASLVGCTSLTKAEAEKIQLINHSLTKTEQGEIVVKGATRNSNPGQVSISVQVKFYDDQKNLMYTGTTISRKIMPGETLDFQVMYKGAEPDKVKSYVIAWLQQKGTPVFPAVSFAIGAGAGAGAFFLIRSTYRNFRKKRIAKGIGLGFASLILVILALIFIISPIGLLIG